MIKFDSSTLFNLIFTIINLLILFFVVCKFLLGPIRKVIAARQAEAEAGFEEAAAVKTEAEGLKAEYEQKMAAADAQSDEIIRESKARAGAEYDSVVADARRKADSIVSEAQAQAQAQVALTLKQGQEQLAAIVADAASKVAETKSSPEADRKLFDDFLAKAGDDK